MEESSEVRNKRLKSQEDNEDRISALPDSIIHHILSLLPSTEQAVRTGILSKRWRNQWTRVPVLIFKAPPSSGDSYLRFIENALNLHECPKLKKFRIDYDREAVVDPNFAAKIRFAIAKCVEELILNCCSARGSYSLPEFFFDCSSLVRLEIYNCDMNPSWRVNFPSLKSLTTDYKSSQGNENIVSGSQLLESLEIRGAYLGPFAIVSESLKVLSFIVGAEVQEFTEISCPNLVEFNMVSAEESNVFIVNPDQMVENVLSSSPSIHSMKLVNCFGFGKLAIASNSLKVLHLEKVRYDKIELSCPNLEKLDLLKFAGGCFQSLDHPRLLSATLDIPLSHHKTGQSDRNILVKQLIEQLHNVKELTMMPLFFKILSNLDLEPRKSLPMLKSNYLTLNIDTPFSLALPGIAYALRSTFLDTLVLNLKSTVQQEKVDEDPQGYWDSKRATDFHSFVSYLTTVKIVGLCEKDAYKDVVEFIEFVLKNARGLMKMAVVLDNPRTGFLVEISQKLLSFPRYSRSASVELLCST